MTLADHETHKAVAYVAYKENSNLKVSFSHCSSAQQKQSSFEWPTNQKIDFCN